MLGENSKLNISREVAAKCLKGIINSDQYALYVARSIVNIVEKRILSELDKVPVRLGDACPTCGGCDVQCAECLSKLLE